MIFVLFCLVFCLVILVLFIFFLLFFFCCFLLVWHGLMGVGLGAGSASCWFGLGSCPPVGGEFSFWGLFRFAAIFLPSLRYIPGTI